MVAACFFFFGSQTDRPGADETVRVGDLGITGAQTEEE